MPSASWRIGTPHAQRLSCGVLKQVQDDFNDLFLNFLLRVKTKHAARPILF